MSRVLLHKLTENFQDSSYRTHTVIPYSKFTTNDHDNEFIFISKLSNRNLKVLCELDTNDIDIIGIKTIIKHLTDYGFDGCLFKNLDKCNIKNFILCISTIKKLPAPYNFDWEFFIDFRKQSCPSIISKIVHYMMSQNTVKYIIVNASCVKTLTDLKYSANRMLLDDAHEKNIEFVKYNKLGGMYIESIKNSMNYINQLKHSLKQQQNHIRYPTSKFLKQIMQRYYEQTKTNTDTDTKTNIGVGNVIDEYLNEDLNENLDEDYNTKTIFESTPTEEIVECKLDIEFLYDV